MADSEAGHPPYQLGGVIGQVLDKLDDRERTEATQRRDVDRAAERADRRRRELAEEFFRSVGRRYRRCRLTNFVVANGDQAEAMRSIKGFLRGCPAAVERGEGLLLYGPPGTGKDHLAIAALHELVAMGKNCRLLKGMELYGQLREAIHAGRSEWSVLGELTQPDVLLISDPALAFARGDSTTDHNRRTLHRLIDRRYDDLKSTWVTVNCADRESLESMLEAAIVDRLTDGATIVFCNWPSYRRPKQ